jgi:hypothetical protein
VYEGVFWPKIRQLCSKLKERADQSHAKLFLSSKMATLKALMEASFEVWNEIRDRNRHD